MLKRFTGMTLFAAFAAAVLVAAEGEAMNQKLKEPAAVPLDFLEWIDCDAGWLQDSLADLDVESGYAITGGVLEATAVEALRAANRIRGFAYLAAPGLRPPYFDLPVKEADGDVVRCVTLFPQSIAPDIGPFDFDREAFPASGADPTILEMCRVDPGQSADYQGLDREAFRARYFDAAGNLKPEFAELNSDPAFGAQAIDHGFFVVQEDYTGRIRLGQE